MTHIKNANFYLMLASKWRRKIQSIIQIVIKQKGERWFLKNQARLLRMLGHVKKLYLKS